MIVEIISIQLREENNFFSPPKKSSYFFNFCSATNSIFSHLTTLPVSLLFSIYLSLKFQNYSNSPYRSRCSIIKGDFFVFFLFFPQRQSVIRQIHQIILIPSPKTLNHVALSSRRFGHQSGDSRGWKPPGVSGPRTQKRRTCFSNGLRVKTKNR